MNKKGFVLMETIVVIVVISVALLTLFSSYNKILSKVQSENTNDNPEYVYMTYYVKEYLKKKYPSLTVRDIGTSLNSDSATDYSDKITASMKNTFNIKKIHLIKNVGGTKTGDNLKYFDAYMIDYIKSLDVNTDDSLIIVEFSKVDVDENYNSKKMYKEDGTEVDLTKTFIASLEW